MNRIISRLGRNRNPVGWGASRSDSKERASVNPKLQKLSTVNETIGRNLTRFKNNHRQLSHWIERRELAIDEINHTEPLQRIRHIIRVMRFCEKEKPGVLGHHAANVANIRRLLHQYTDPKHLLQLRSQGGDALFWQLSDIQEQLEEICKVIKAHRTGASRSFLRALTMIENELRESHQHQINFADLELFGHKMWLSKRVNWDHITRNEIKYLLNEIDLCQSHVLRYLSATREMESYSAKGDHLAIDIADQGVMSAEEQQQVKQFDQLQKEVNDAASLNHRNFFSSFVRNGYQRLLKFVRTTSLKEMSLIGSAIIVKTILSPIKAWTNLLFNLPLRAYYGVNSLVVRRKGPPSLIPGVREWKSKALHRLKSLENITNWVKDLGGSLFSASFLPGIFFPPFLALAGFGGGLFVFTALFIIAPIKFVQSYLQKIIAKDLSDGMKNSANSIQEKILSLRSYVCTTPKEDLEDAIVLAKSKEILQRIENYRRITKASILSEFNGLVNIFEALAASILIFSGGELAQNGPKGFKAFFQDFPNSFTNQLKLIEILKQLPEGAKIASPIAQAQWYKNVMTEYHLFASEDQFLGETKNINFFRPINSVANQWRLQTYVWATVGRKKAAAISQ